MNNYDLVLFVIESYEDKRILNDFKSSFIEGENVSKEDYDSFNNKYISDGSDGWYIDLNWKFIESGGDWSVYDDEIM
jgi:hypothetical protein